MAGRVGRVGLSGGSTGCGGAAGAGVAAVSAVRDNWEGRTGFVITITCREKTNVVKLHHKIL